MTDKQIKKLSKFDNDKDLMLECVKLILSKNKVDHLNDILEESNKLYNFIIKDRI